MEIEYLNSDNYYLNTTNESITVGNWEWNVQTGETKFDERWAGIAGYKLDELQPTTIETWRNLVHREDFEKSEMNLDLYFRNQRDIYESEVRMRHKSGKWVWVLDRGKIIEYDVYGKPLKMAGSHYDITTRKIIEEASKNSEYRKMLDNTPYPILILSSKEKVVKYANTRALHDFDLSKRDLIKLKVDDYFVNSKQADFLLGEIRVNGQLYNFELELYNTKHEKYWASISASTIDFENELSVIIQIENINDRKKNEERIEHLYLLDSVTGLKNKTALRLFEESIISNTELLNKFTVIYIDLDDFGKLINEIGYYSADLILAQVAQKIKEVTDQNGFVFYYTGDEFVVILNKHTKTEVEEYMDLLRRAISTQILVNERIQILYASMGYEIIDKSLYDKDLLRNAKLALGVAKQQKNTYVQYTSILASKIERELLLEKDLRNSLDKQELELYYQPIFNVQSGMVDQAEALLRWNHPKLGVISPIEFIPIAEKTKLIIPITDWVIHETCSKLASWDESKFGLLSISINLSFITISDRKDELYNCLKNELNRSGINPKRLKLEVTESSLVQDSIEVIKVFNRLRELGLSLALDDFGTGYSSFAYLRMLPLDIVKIDHSLISSIESDQKSLKIVEAIISILHGLNLEVTIEGVETLNQFKILSELRPDSIQGYLFSKPLRLIDFKLYYHAAKDINFLPVSKHIFENKELRNYWKVEWNSGNRIIDHQHQELIAQLYDLRKLLEGRTIDSIELAYHLDNLLIKIGRHFTDEVEILEATKYINYKEHHSIHKKLVRTIYDYYDQYKSNNITVLEFLSVLEFDILKHHFFEEDQKYFIHVSELSSKFPLNYIDASIVDQGIYDQTIDKILLKIASEFIRSDKSDYQKLISKSLKLIGTVVKADRVYIFKYDWTESTCSNTYEWCSPGITAQIEVLQKIPLGNIIDWVNAHIVGETIFIPDVELLDPESSVRLILEPQEVKSLLTLPMMFKNACYGFIGFDSVRDKHIYSKIELEVLSDLSEILLNALLNL